MESKQYLHYKRLSNFYARLAADLFMRASRVYAIDPKAQNDRLYNLALDVHAASEITMDKSCRILLYGHT